MTLFEVVNKEIQTKIDIILDRLGGGQASDYAEYKFQCGVLYGLYAIRTYIEELRQNLEGEE